MADEGVIVPDDAALWRDGVLWRRLTVLNTPPDNSNPGKRRLSSGGFDDSSDGSGMSVHLQQPGETPSDHLSSMGRPLDGIAEIFARDLKTARLGLKHVPEERDPHHYEVMHPEGMGKKAKKNTLLGIARMIIEPREHE